MSERVLTFTQALAEVLRHARSIAGSPSAETVDLLSGAGRVLAAEIAADRDQPPFDRSTRDGYAVRSRDIAGALRVIGSLRAGESWKGSAVAEGEAVEIMTGAPLPPGADAVAMVEHATLADGLLRIEDGRVLSAGNNVVPRGAEAHAGDRLLPAGCVLGAAEIAVAASCGCSRVEVFMRPRVAIVATGDELVELSQPMDAWQIRNSNSYALAALVQAEGGIGECLPPARDTIASLRERIAQARAADLERPAEQGRAVEQGRAADLLLLSGGVSMGKYDLVEQVLLEAGAEFLFTGALIQPGRPVVFGRLPRVDSEGWMYFFGLPGNPVSTQVCFHLFVAPMLHALAGRKELGPRFGEARLAEAVKGGARVTRFLPAELTGAWDGVEVRVVGWQGSGDVAANARGNCYAVFPSEVESFRAGETVRVLLR